MLRTPAIQRQGRAVVTEEFCVQGLKQRQRLEAREPAVAPWGGGLLRRNRAHEPCLAGQTGERQDDELATRWHAPHCTCALRVSNRTSRWRFTSLRRSQLDVHLLDLSREGERQLIGEVHGRTDVHPDVDAFSERELDRD